MRTVFLGTSAFAAGVLERLACGGHRPALALTRPDRPQGRGRKLGAPPVAQAARRLGIALEQPPNINEPAARELIASADPDVVIVCAFGALISEPLLSEHELLNVHPSLLPRWRGAAPVERAIMAGDERTGVCIMRLTAGLDRGPVCAAESTAIHADDTCGSLAERLQTLGGELIVRVLDLTARGEPPAFVEQDEDGVTYAEKIGPEDRLLDPARSAQELERVVRALHPHVGARVALADGTLLGVRRAALADGPSSDLAQEELVETAEEAVIEEAVAEEIVAEAVDANASAGAGAPGVAVRDGRLQLDCTPGVLELLEVQPPGGRAMEAPAYLRGHGPPGRR
jgi:methionyl-tRNA formyltransferase